MTLVYEAVFLDEASTEEDIKRACTGLVYDREVVLVELSLSPEAPLKPDSFCRCEAITKGMYRTAVPGVPVKMV